MYVCISESNTYLHIEMRAGVLFIAHVRRAHAQTFHSCYDSPTTLRAWKATTKPNPTQMPHNFITEMFLLLVFRLSQTQITKTWAAWVSSRACLPASLALLPCCLAGAASVCCVQVCKQKINKMLLKDVVSGGGWASGRRQKICMWVKLWLRSGRWDCVCICMCA